MRRIRMTPAIKASMEKEREYWRSYCTVPTLEEYLWDKHRKEVMARLVKEDPHGFRKKKELCD